MNAESLEAVEREREREREYTFTQHKTVGSEICKFVNETILKHRIKAMCFRRMQNSFKMHSFLAFKCQ